MKIMGGCIVNSYNQFTVILAINIYILPRAYRFIAFIIEIFFYFPRYRFYSKIVDIDTDGSSCVSIVIPPETQIKLFVV